MIIQRCDICKKEVDNINSVILYKKNFDYCENCKEEAEELINRFKDERKYQNILYDSVLRNKEMEYLSKYDKRTKKKKS